MPRYKVEWSQVAIDRLEEIRLFIAETAKSEVPAAKFILKLIDRTILLAAFPQAGQSEPHFEAAGKQRRYLVEGDYKIIYKIEGSKVIVTDVFHTKLNPDKLTTRDAVD